MKETNDESIKREEIEKIEALRPMSRLEFQILYGKCASSGWVYGESNETLYQQYIQRYGFFLCHLISLKGNGFELAGLLTHSVEGSDIYFLVDESGLIHTISLPGTNVANAVTAVNAANDNAVNVANAANINWFFAESPNTPETYVYNPKRATTPYYSGPLQILAAAAIVVQTTTEEPNWINQNIILLDFFPFPIITSTDIRKDVVEKGYTFRMHLSEYFKPLVKNVKKIFDAPALVAAPANVYLISPPYTSVHAIFELTDFEWAKLVTLNASSAYKQSTNKASCGFDQELTPASMYMSFLTIRDKEYIMYNEKFLAEVPKTPNPPESQFDLTKENIKALKEKQKTQETQETLETNEAQENYKKMCAYLKKRIYLNNGNVPGIQELKNRVKKGRTTLQ